MIRRSLLLSKYIAQCFLLLYSDSSVFYCQQLFNERNLEEISYNRLHPQDTSEIQQSLSTDLEEKEKSQTRFFAAVIDGGSTGTRLHVFEFSHDPTHEHSNFKLESETFKEVKLGVSCFARTPELAAENVRELLLVAKKFIPQELWAKTPMTFKATAGVRLLSEKEANAILTNIEMEVMSSGFLVDDDAVGVLSGTDEGVFGWFTLNFLLKRLNNITDTGKTAVALDLGGGSTQVTFLPSDFSTAIKGVSRQQYSHRLKVFGKELRLYTHSYLGNGLVASRLGISKLSTPEWDQSAAPTLRTHCLPTKFVLDDWDYAGNVWIISATPDASFENCLEVSKQYVTNLTSIKPIVDSALGEDIYLFGYYYDRGVQGNVIEYSLEQTGGETRVGDFKDAAEKACAIPTEAIGPEHWRPWQCLDLTYIYTLLRYGYGLTDEKSINLAKKVRSMEVSWALGAGFHLLNSYHESKLNERREQRHREMRAALEWDRQELEQRRKEMDAREAAASGKLASSPENNIFADGMLDGKEKSALVNFVTTFIQKLSDIITHILTSLNFIS